MAGAVGLLWTGNWYLCEAAVEIVLSGGRPSPPPVDGEKRSEKVDVLGGLYLTPLQNGDAGKRVAVEPSESDTTRADRWGRVTDMAEETKKLLMLFT